MKKTFLIVFALLFLISCGPHRMRCGARGICETNVKIIKKNS